MQRHNTNVINLNHRIIFSSNEIKPQFRLVRSRNKLHQIILEGTRPLVARIHGIHRTTIEHDAYKAFIRGALIEEGPEPQVVRDAADEPEVLIHGRWIQARVRVLWAQLVELVGEAGGVAGGGDGVFGVENVFGDPGGETAFEAAIADGVVGGTGGLTGWGWRGRRGECGAEGGFTGAGGAVTGSGGAAGGGCSRGEARCLRVYGCGVGCAEGGGGRVCCWTTGGE